MVPAQAQLGDKLRGLVEVDLAAPPEHDTAYVAEYRSNLLLSGVVKLQTDDIGMEPATGDALEYTTNGAELYGLGLDYKWLSVEALFSVPQWNDLDPSLGTSSSRGFGLGITRPRLWARAFWNTTEGYYMTSPERWTGSPAPYVRGDISNRLFLVSVNYALDKRCRYSQRAATYQTERQKKSAGTFVMGFSGWHATVKGDSSLLEPSLLDTFRLAIKSFHEAQRLLLGATFGYTHTFVIGHKGFIHASLLPGLAYTHQWLASDADRLHGIGMVPVIEFKAGVGFNGDRWYCALTTAYHYTTAQIADDLYLSLNHGQVRLALGLRFGDPGIEALRKVGL